MGGVGEAMSLLSGAVGIVNGGRKAYKFLSREDREEQSATIRVVREQFLAVKESFRNSGARGDLRTAVDVKLKQLERYVEELDKWDLALNSGNVYQRNKRGRRKAAKRIETLRTGISDIENALKSQEKGWRRWFA